MGRRRKSSPVRGMIRAGRRTANRTLYVFGPILLFVMVLTIWYISDPSSFNAMAMAVSKFFHALNGGN